MATLCTGWPLGRGAVCMWCGIYVAEGGLCAMAAGVFLWAICEPHGSQAGGLHGTPRAVPLFACGRSLPDLTASGRGERVRELAV